MADEGGIDVLVSMLDSPHPHLQRQCSKALANLGVNTGNKYRICKAGAVAPLVKLAASKTPSIAIEAIAALANLAVNGELQIADHVQVVSTVGRHARLPGNLWR